VTARLCVVHVYQDFYPKRGGIEDHIFDLARALGESCATTVLTSNGGARTTRETIPLTAGVNAVVDVIRVGAIGRYYTPFCPTLPLWLRRVPADVVHLHEPCPMAVLAALVARPRAKLVLSYHNDIVRPLALWRLYRPFLFAAMQRAARIVVSSVDYATTSPILPRFKDKWAVIPYGIFLDDFTSTPARARQANALREQCGRPIVLFVGRLCYYKGLEYLIEAASQVQATFLLIGRGPWAARLRREVERRGLSSRVRFVGEISESELPTYLYASDLIVLPSTWRSEAFGLVLLKAFACGRPAVTTNLAGVAWVNRHNVTGLTVPPRRALALVEAINHLLSDARLREQMGQAARDRVQSFNAATMAARMYAVYHETRC